MFFGLTYALDPSAGTLLLVWLVGSSSCGVIEPAVRGRCKVTLTHSYRDQGSDHITQTLAFYIDIKFSKLHIYIYYIVCVCLQLSKTFFRTFFYTDFSI